jgi:endonuclease YncB( thermonuclease family)
VPPLRIARLSALSALTWAAAGLTATAVAAPSASAAAAPCVPGTSAPVCQAWTGRVTFVDDGDTLDVRVAGRVQRVRIAGIQAMEQTAYSATPAKRRGSCSALAATAALDALVARAHGVVRLTAQHAGTSSRGRPVRSVAVRIGGRWRDVGSAQLASGDALWWPLRAEDAWNATYRVLAQRAAAAGRGIYAPARCGSGPSPDAALRLWVNWDADGNDDADVDGEWVVVRNDGPAAVAIGGWTLRDSALRSFTFPAGATIGPHATITLHVGSGTPGDAVFFWGQSKPVFENATADGDGAMGDGGYLFDPRGNLRAFSIFPCRVACADPLDGRLGLTVDPAAKQESATIENRGAAAVDLEGYRLEAYPRGFAFPSGTVVQPGQRLRVVVGGTPADDEPLLLHWPVDTAPILANAGGAVRVATFTGVTVACASWGSGSCSGSR